jgi:hypothetical protein
VFSIRHFERKKQEDGSMIKVFRFVAMGAISVALATLSIASAQTYTTVDFPGATATTLNGGPNPQGTSVGGYTTSGVTHGFTLTKKGVFTSFDPPGSTLTSPNFISPQGDIVGGYNDSSSVSHGFILSGRHYTTVNFPGAAGTVLTGLNPSGEMSGFYCSDPACGTTGDAGTNQEHSFVVSKKGVFTSFDPPGAVSSEASTVNPSGAVVGSYDNSAEGTCFTQCQGYLLDKKGTFTTIDFPGAIFTFGGGNNPEGDIVGEETDTAGVGHAFLLSNGAFTSFDLPGAIFTDAAGINPGGIIVGIYFDSAGVEHGFIRKP